RPPTSPRSGRPSAGGAASSRQTAALIGEKREARQPFLFRMKDGQPFAFAGLWDRWAKGDGREMCAILTTAENELVRPFHEPMPVILPLASHDDRLAPQADAPQGLQTVLRLCPAPRWCLRSISRRPCAICRSQSRKEIDPFPRLPLR